MDLIQDNPRRVRNSKMGTFGLKITSFTALDNFISKQLHLTSVRGLRSSCNRRCATGVIGFRRFGRA